MLGLQRRNFLLLGSKAAAAGLVAIVGRDAHAAKVSNSALKSKWIDRLNEKKISDSPLYLGRFRDPMYFLTAPISWKPNPDQVGKAQPVEAPAGFVTDLASVPPVFFSLLRPDDDYAYAAILHDYLYWTQGRPKAEADLVIKYAMEDFSVAAWKKETIYRAVVAAGQSAWDKNAALKQQGEKRILKKYPPNARVSWADWKRQPEVFAP
ncbi:DUF1353 domain-containing protein [Bradyrhizobium sp. SZCCHNRI1058]|uniref:DUF1353 domain-containing protein n=1 Tax=Bradyrhizobium sp. SZCCHNRI1058 TaxID=3057279 RepID=UPI002915ED31|nr:DUF1353 domain-containing protein [Bradyrhizobium sp. SZCCHNRI1058]